VSAVSVTVQEGLGLCAAGFELLNCGCNHTWGECPSLIAKLGMACMERIWSAPVLQVLLDAELQEWVSMRLMAGRGRRPLHAEWAPGAVMVCCQNS
jgi:hypothetical protein